MTDWAEASKQVNHSCYCEVCHQSQRRQEFVIRCQGQVCCHGSVSVFHRLVDAHRLWPIKVVEHPVSQGLKEGKAVGVADQMSASIVG